jgi:hypothetical protein
VPVLCSLDWARPYVVRYTVDTKEHNGWYYYITLWAIAPSYRDEVIITGHQWTDPMSYGSIQAEGSPAKSVGTNLCGV